MSDREVSEMLINVHPLDKKQAGKKIYLRKRATHQLQGICFGSLKHSDVLENVG